VIVGLDSVPPFCAGGVLVRADDGAVDKMYFPVNLIRGIRLLL
jgi:hypothetical protein